MSLSYTVTATSALGSHFSVDLYQKKKKPGNDFRSQQSTEEDQASGLWQITINFTLGGTRKWQMQTNPEHTHSYTWALFKRGYSASCQLGTIEAEIWKRGWTCLNTSGPPLHRVAFSSLPWLQVISCFYLDTLGFAFTCSCFVTRLKDDRAGPVPNAARKQAASGKPINEVNLPPKGDVSKVLASQMTCKIQWRDNP